MNRLQIFRAVFHSRTIQVVFILSVTLFFGLAAGPFAYALDVRTWGGEDDDEGLGVAVDSSGNTYVTGETESGTEYAAKDLVLLKYDASGTLQWKRTWGGGGDEEGFGVAVDSSDNIYVTGYTTSLVSFFLVLLKFNSAGSLLWQKGWGDEVAGGGEKGYGVAVDSSGDIYVTGTTNSTGAGSYDLVLLKFDSTGGLVWQRTWGGTNDDQGRGVAVSPLGSIYVTGYSNSFLAGAYEVVLLKFDSEGSLVWQKLWGGDGAEMGSAVDVSPLGSIYVTGFTNSFGAGMADIALLKYNSTGGLVWQRTWGGEGNEYGRGVAVDASGRIYVIGDTPSFATSSDVALLKFNAFGKLIWQRTWGGDELEEGCGAAVDSGNAYFTGYTGDEPRTLNTVSGTVNIPSGTVGSPTFALGTPTTLQVTNTSWAPLTPGGQETYAGGEDIFLLRFQIARSANLADLEDFTTLPTNNMALVVGDIVINPHGSKPSGVNYQQGRDMTPLGFVSGMLENPQPSIFDTNSTWINATSGRPFASIPPELIFSIGGPGINSVTYYYENTAVAGDMAPVKFGYNSTHFYWMFTSNGTKVPGSEILQSSTAVPPGTSDVFVIQILHDPDGRLVVLMYGTRYTGTWAAAWCFKFIVYPNIASYTNSYYIVRWTDAASGAGSDYTPDLGDTYTILAQG